MAPEETEILLQSEPSRGEPPQSGRITVERVVRIVLWSLFIVLFLVVVWYFSRLVIYLVVGAILAYLMRPIVDRFQSVGMGAIPAILITFVVVFGGISILLRYLVPFVAGQVSEISQLISPSSIQSILAAIEDRLPVAIQDGSLTTCLEAAITTLFEADRISNVMSSIVGVFANLFYAVVVVPFVTFFFLKDGTSIKQNLLQLAPNKYFEITLTIVEKVESNMGRYLRGLLLQSVSIGTVASILLYLAGVEYALAVGLFVGLANTIPYFGPVMGILAGSLIGIAQTGDLTLFVPILIAMGITQILDNIFFQPLIFSRAARAHPLIILFVVLIGAQLAGIVGMLIAIPLTTTIRVIIEQVNWSIRNYQILQYT
ncbi:MAG: AI-2E family transporter [Rhodothermales bacterium]|nr:AI-2E family transporter [Rhodothermales bacterium]